jgi:hypothetical protein
MFRIAKQFSAIALAFVSSSVFSFDVQPWALPNIAAPAAQPDLVLTPRGEWLVSWLEKGNDGEHRMRFVREQRGRFSTSEWSPAQTIASGKDWFVNWADTPHVIALEDGSLWAHWLRRNGRGLYDYGIALTRSGDDGLTWSDAIRVEPHGAKNDYGFVSMWPHARGALGIAWLDSRQKPEHGDHADHTHQHGGAMSAAMMLRAAVFNASGAREIEWPLDASTCDCCTTAVARTLRGPVIVYRGRGVNEVRDTRIVRFENDLWTAPRDVHVDGWNFAGCPVNGPSVTAFKNEVWVAWYTEADGQPSLRLARSDDAGDQFAKPMTIAQGESVLGRIALAIDKRHVWMAWLEERASPQNTQALWLARVDRKTGKFLEKERVAELAARGRSSGLPRLAVRDRVAHLVWTDIADGKTRLRAVRAR